MPKNKNNSIKVYRLSKKNIVDFAKERNNILKSSIYNWILFIDNDEELVPEKIDPSILNGFDAFKLIRKNYFLGFYVGSEKLIRLLKKGSGKWKRPVHEYFEIRKNKKVGLLKNFLIHNTATNIKGYISKINFYSDLHAKQNLKENKKSNILKIVFFPFLKFFVTLFFSQNIVFSIMQSLHSYLSWSKQYLKN